MTKTPVLSASPLRVPVFRALWIATIVSNVGTWMHDVGAGWLMTSLSPEPLMVALVQAATTLPMFLLALPGGALADIIDRRRLLIGAQGLSLIAAALLAAASFAGLTTPGLLLAFTAVIAAGAALSAPAFQAIVPELVPLPAVQQAVALNSLGINISRAIGPALGGLIIAAAGPGAVFALNAVSVTGIIFVLTRWSRTQPDTHLPAEHFFGALRAGARYAAGAPELQIVLVRSIGFFLFASALWALLPLIARRELGLGPGAYGGLLTLMGLGAVAGAWLLPRLRTRLSPNRVTTAASLLFAVATAGLGFAQGFASSGALLAVGGLAWIGMMASLNGSAQAASPAWVKARALAIYLVTFQGAMTAGSALWGTLAGHIGIPATLIIAGTGLILVLVPMALRFPLGQQAALDLTSSSHWPTPVIAGEVRPDRGPVMIMIEYHVNKPQVRQFMTAMQQMKRIRKRDGAISWGVYEDAAQPGRMIETFVVESWLEHLRQHERVTHADRENQEAVRAFHIGPHPPIVRHLIRPV